MQVHCYVIFHSSSVFSFKDLLYVAYHIVAFQLILSYIEGYSPILG